MEYIPYSLEFISTYGYKAGKTNATRRGHLKVKCQFVYSSPHKDIRVEFTGKNLTKFGGIQLVRKFFRGLKVKEEFESAVTIERRDSRFSVGGTLVCLLYTVIL